jgi:hypothetical protein
VRGSPSDTVATAWTSFYARRRSHRSTPRSTVDFLMSGDNASTTIGQHLDASRLIPNSNGAATALTKPCSPPAAANSPTMINTRDG